MTTRSPDCVCVSLLCVCICVWLVGWCNVVGV